MSTSVVWDYEPLYFHFLIGKGCGFHVPSPNNASGSGLIRGIHVFLSTIIHEVEHAKIECEVWGSGYNSKEDSESDGYNDDWEMDHIQDGFVVGQEDTYNPNYKIENGVYFEMTNGSWVPATAGTRYEETRCRLASKNFLMNLSGSNPFESNDWSFDPTNIDQGKQYKN